MDILQILSQVFSDYTLRTVSLGSAVLGIVSGALGSFAVLRKQSLLGDTISHAALPGVVLAFLLTRSKEPLVLVVGAGIAGWLATLWVITIIKHTRIKEDAALGLVLPVFFGLGMMLLTYTQRLPDARQAGLDHFLFGQAAALLERDVITMAIIGAVALLLMSIFWKEFKLLAFDRDFGHSLGFPTGRLDVLLTTLLVIAIVIGLQAVGVVLMSAMVVAPAAAARQWTDRLGVMVALAAFFGALAGVAGTIISTTARGLSTGPTIVLSASVLVLFSLLFAPNRGLVSRAIRRNKNRRTLRMEAVASDLYWLSNQHPGEQRPHSIEVLRAMSFQQGGVARSLQELERRGWVSQAGKDGWMLTEMGSQQARDLLNDRNSKPLTGG
ncbi:MAG TPA: iron chelate uptake ABC transporter family permease subunit [Levilinea sp.]|nr:iron chelate uptake ABC transporter family permease subunit [Levilinea sp.]